MTPRDIKAARRTLGLSVSGFAALVGASPRTVRRWEKGTLQPSPDKIETIKTKLRERTHERVIPCSIKRRRYLRRTG